MNNKKIYAVTGGIGSGKSLVLSQLKNLGFDTVSCDEEIAKLYNESFVIEKISSFFPTSVKNGKIDKKILSNIVFNDKKELNKLNSFFHPIVLDICFKKAKESLSDFVFIEVPLLFENGLQKLFDGVIVVKRNVDKRIESVLNRSKLSKKEVIDRINNQFDYDNSDLSEYYVLDNNLDKKSLSEKIKDLVNIL